MGMSDHNMAEQPQTLGPQSASTVLGHGHVRDGNGEVGLIIPTKLRLTTISVVGSAVEPETVLSHANEVWLRVENHTGAMSLNLTVSTSDTHADTN
jgi:hypothetical protein